MSSISSHSRAFACDNVRLRAWDIDQLERSWPDWDGLTRTQRAQQVINYGHHVEAEQVVTSSNTTCIGLDEARVKSFDITKSYVIRPDEIELGSGTGTSHADRNLSNKETSIEIETAENQGTDIFIAGYLDTTELNNVDLTEIGVRLSDGSLANHSEFSTISKTANRAVTAEVVISFTSPNA